MLDDPLLLDLFDVAEASGSLPERARGWLRLLERFLPFDAAWLSVSSPGATALVVVASSGLDGAVRTALELPETVRDVERAGLHRPGAPMSVADLHMPLDDLSIWFTCLGPAGFREILASTLVDADGTLVGHVGLLYRRAETPSAQARTHLARLSPLIARGLSPRRALLASARLVPSAGAAVLLLHDGTIRPFPGLDSHDMLHEDSPAVRAAHESLVTGFVSRSFLWPVPGADGEGRHARLTLVSVADQPRLGGGAVLFLTDDADCRGLTPRELQVLGLLVDGRSNQQMSRTLAVTPRTIATHVEHVMRKLEAPSRTLAAVRAEREGLFVPPR